MTEKLKQMDADRIARGAALHGKLLERPSYCHEEHLEYLDRLREVGICEMDSLGATEHLEREFPEDKLGEVVSFAEGIILYRGKRSHMVLIHWHATFNERHGA